MSGVFWSAHTHSRYSAKDGLPAVEAVVRRAAELGYPALGLTDHGNMAGSVELYNGCRAAGIEPLPGMEAYVAFDRSHRSVQKDGRPGRIKTHHACLLATSTAGYRNLVRLNNTAVRNFNYVPVLDLGDLAAAAEAGALEGVAMTTGCWFGLVAKQLREGDPSVTLNMLKALQGFFGDRLLVELQNHQIIDDEHDDELHTELMFGLAQQIGAPVILTQDSHYTHREHRRDHDAMKQLLSWNTENPDDAVFPGDGFHMVDTAWMKKHHEPAIFAAGMEGLDHLLGMAQVRIPELDTFTLTVPDTTGNGTADEVIESVCRQALKTYLQIGLYPERRAKTYQARLDEELEVITGQGFSGYLLFVAWVTDWMRERDIRWNVRGSAAGSLVCHLLGITHQDPVHWKLDFDRFLSRDYTKPPDIDLDVPSDRRGEIATALKKHFHVTHISNWSRLGVSKDDDEGDKGSLLVLYKVWAGKTGRDKDAPIPTAVMNRLRSLGEHEAYGNYGVHAAGLLVTPDEAAVEKVPLSWVASSKTLISSYDMESVEKLGLVKLDLLGQISQSALRTMEDLTGIYREDIPLNDRGTLAMMGSGRTTGVFQLDGWSARKGCKQLKPRNIHDVIAAMALFRPGAQKSGAAEAYIERRHGREAVPQRHPLLMERTKNTFGVIVYQEQVLGILKDLGLAGSEADKAKKAIKASNKGVADARATLEQIFAKVRELGAERGMDAADLEFLGAALQAYADYGFNQAHATAYGIVAYQTAWFRRHHPVAFWGGMLKAYDGHIRLPDMVREAVADAVPLLPAHVNHSGASYTVDLERNAIRRGLTSVKQVMEYEGGKQRRVGVGPQAAEELAKHAPYTSLSDLGQRVNHFRVKGAKWLAAGHPPESCGGAIRALALGGALKGLSHTEEVREAYREDQAKKKARAERRAELAAQRAAAAERKEA